MLHIGGCSHFSTLVQYTAPEAVNEESVKPLQSYFPEGSSLTVLLLPIEKKWPYGKKLFHNLSRHVFKTWEVPHGPPARVSTLLDSKGGLWDDYDIVYVSKKRDRKYVHAR